MYTSKTKGIRWLVRRDGICVSLHRSPVAAHRAAGHDGRVLTVAWFAPEIQRGDRVYSIMGIAIYRKRPRVEAQ